VNEPEKKVFYKTKFGITVIVLVALTGISMLFSEEPVASTPTPTPAVKEAATPTEPTLSKEQAQKELDSIMDLGKKSGLVTSYEFSNSASVVYVGNIWYTQTVQQKKDFIAYVGLRKKAITGYSHFEVRDGHSNEKVAELTAFTSSIEVYK